MLSMVSSVSPTGTGQGDGVYQTGFIRWRAADNGFNGWSLSGVKLNVSGALEFDPATARADSDPYPAGTYNRGNYYNGGSFFVGEATSPEISTPFNYKQAIVSWNASTSAGSWLEVQFRAQYGTHWSKWYVLGIWAADTSTVARHSVKAQKDSDGSVADDTFISSAENATTNTFQLKLRLFSADGLSTPGIRSVAVAYSTSIPKSGNASAGNPALWDRLIDVPKFSQMVYPDGGSVWCSPTSTSMVLSFLDNYKGDCAPRVHAAVDGVFDWIYEGHGNWPFNTAYAATFGYQGYVVRLTSLAKVEEYVAAGIPVIMSVAWDKGELTNSGVDSTNGHLLVLVGFDAAGNLIVNDPASPTNEAVRRTYLRSEFEPLWLQSSGGTVYLIYPEKQGTLFPTLP
jgi:peptidase C39-like protein